MSASWTEEREEEVRLEDLWDLAKATGRSIAIGRIDGLGYAWVRYYEKFYSDTTGPVQKGDECVLIRNDGGKECWYPVESAERLAEALSDWRAEMKREAARTKQSGIKKLQERC